METYCVDLGAEFVRRGIAVTAVVPAAVALDLVAQRFEDCRRCRRAHGDDGRRWPRRTTPPVPTDDAPSSFAAPDVVHVNVPGGKGGLVLAAASRLATGAVVVITEHDVPPERHPVRQRLAPTHHRSRRPCHACRAPDGTLRARLALAPTPIDVRLYPQRRPGSGSSPMSRSAQIGQGYVRSSVSPATRPSSSARWCDWQTARDCGISSAHSRLSLRRDRASFCSSAAARSCRIAALTRQARHRSAGAFCWRAAGSWCLCGCHGRLRARRP